MNRANTDAGSANSDYPAWLRELQSRVPESYLWDHEQGLAEAADEMEKLRAALKEAVRFVADGIVACRGDRCRLPNCESCWSEPEEPDWSIINAGTGVPT